MGSRRITETFKRSVLRTDTDGLIGFLQAMRDLESPARETYIKERTYSAKQRVERYEKDLNSESRFERDYAATRLPEAREDYRQELLEADASTQMQAKFHSTKGRAEEYVGTPEEIVKHNQFSKYSTIYVYPSGRPSARTILIMLGKRQGVSVEIDTKDMQLYDEASLRIPAELVKVSVPYNFLFRPSLVMFSFIFLFVTSVSNLLFDLDKSTEAIVLIVGYALVLIALFRYAVFPNIQIKDEPTLRKQVLGKIGYVLGALAIGIVGAIIYGWLPL